MPESPPPVDDAPAAPQPSWRESLSKAGRTAWKHWKSILTVASFVISIASASFSCQQAENGKRQAAAAEGNKKAAEASAGAATRSAGAAEKALEQTLSEIRPRMAVTMANVSTLTVGQKPVVDLFIKNDGRAPATNVSHRVWMQLLDAGVKTLPHPATERIVAESLASNAHLITGKLFSRALTQQEVDGVRDGKKAMFVYGTLEYHDKDKRHEIQWCSLYMAEKPTAFGMLPSCSFHNASF